MRKMLSMLIVLTVMALLSVPVSARTCGKLRHRHGDYWHTHYMCVGDGHKHGRSFWQKHRDKLTVAGGALGGAALGGIIGGKKGGAIGPVTRGGRGGGLHLLNTKRRALARPLRHRLHISGGR